MKAVQGLPEFQVEVEGAPLEAEALRALESLRVQQRLGTPALCELTLVEPRGTASTWGLAPGAALRVAVAAQGEPLFTGEITAVEHLYGSAGARRLRVRGYDLLHRLRKRQPVRAHVQVTVEELARELVAEWGLSVEAATPGPLWRHLLQAGQTDWELLVEVAERCGLYPVLEDGVLRLLTLEGQGVPVPLLLGESLLEARVEINGETVCREVATQGWNPLAAETHTAEISDARVGRQVEAEVSPDQVGGTGTRTLVNQRAEGTAHAEALARAELDWRVASEVILTGLSEGNALLRPGTRVEVRGVAPEVAGRYVLCSVTHTVDARHGFLTELSTEPPARRPRPRAAPVLPGVVSRVDDPDNRGRVRVSLPTCGGVETDWMQVLSAGAGAGKGLVMLPDVGDTVLLVVAGEDPGQGLVVGGLYGTSGPADAGVSGGAVRRFILSTPGGHRLRLDDEARTLRLEDSTGSFLEMGPERVRLQARVPLEIEAPGKPVVVGGSAIDFQRRS